MLKIYDLIFAYIFRLPLLLLLYSIVLVITGDPTVIFRMLVFFVLICGLDALTDRFRLHVVMGGIILAGVLLFFGDYASVITIFIFTMYIPERY